MATNSAWLSQIKSDFKVGWIHNPREFQSGSFWTEIERINGHERIVLYGKNKRSHKSPGQVRKVAILKRRETYVNIFGERIWK